MNPLDTPDSLDLLDSSESLNSLDSLNWTSFMISGGRYWISLAMDLVASVPGYRKAYTPWTEAMGPEDNPKCLRGHFCLLPTAPALKNNYNNNFIIYALFVFVVSAAGLYSHKSTQSCIQRKMFKMAWTQSLTWLTLLVVAVAGKCATVNTGWILAYKTLLPSVY